MLQASAEDTGFNFESLLVHTFDLGNDVRTLLNGSLFEQNQSQAVTFLAGSAMASMPHDLEANLATDSIQKSPSIVLSTLILPFTHKAMTIWT